MHNSSPLIRKPPASEKIAQTIESRRQRASFQSLLSDTQFVTDHLFPSRIVQLRYAGKTLKPSHVYSHKQPLVLGGDDNADNVEVTDVGVHVSIHGQVHRQVNDLPDGASIDSIKID